MICVCLKLPLKLKQPQFHSVFSKVVVKQNFSVFTKSIKCITVAIHVGPVYFTGITSL